MRTIEAADQIVVLDKGVVAEKGSHDELMRNRGLYRKLVDLQTEAANWKLCV
jgi:ATP-binding cassette subfamily B protein